MSEIHPAMLAANRLGCFVGLFLAHHKGAVMGVSAAILNIESGEIQGEFEVAGPTEREALDNLHAKLKAAVNE